jgi:hypothetical protein
MPGLFAVGEPIPATPPMHGLQASAAEVTTPARWELGASFCPENCVEAAGWDPDCSAWPEGVKPDKSEAEHPLDCYDVMPFALESAFKCDASGFKVLDFAGRARRQLEASTSKGMEFELWTGTIKPDNPQLDQGATYLSEGPMALLQGLTMLGQALSNCAHGGRGMIHAPTFVVDSALALYPGLFRIDGNRIVTTNRGDVVVSGTGYPGTGEDGLDVDAGLSWIYATGPVQYRLGETIVFPDTVAEAVDRRQNNIEYRAERMALINFDTCCHFGILVDPSLDFAHAAG